jgi:hypothetical protein
MSRYERMCKLGENQSVIALGKALCWYAVANARADPVAVWNNLAALDPNPPGPLAAPPYMLALPDDWMDDELFLSEAMRIYCERGDPLFMGAVFRPIPRSIQAEEITFVVPDRGMDERTFADKAVRVRLALEHDWTDAADVESAVWA